MNRYYVEMEHPRGKEEHGTFYIYMYAYDSQQIIDMIDQVIVAIEKTYEQGENNERGKLMMKNNIDINQYIQFDEKICDMIIYFNKTKFLEDALEYLQNDNPDHEIIEE